LSFTTVSPVKKKRVNGWFFKKEGYPRPTQNKTPREPGKPICPNLEAWGWDTCDKGREKEKHHIIFDYAQKIAPEESLPQSPRPTRNQHPTQKSGKESKKIKLQNDKTPLLKNTDPKTTKTAEPGLVPPTENFRSGQPGKKKPNPGEMEKGN